MDRKTNITIAGAGSIGCYLGGSLAVAGRHRITLLGRARLMQTISERGLAVRDLGEAARAVPPGALLATDDPEMALKRADLVLVTVKCMDTPAMAALVARHTPPAATIVSIQNGVGNKEVLKPLLAPGQQVLAGMVPFNVVQTAAPGAPPHFHKSTSGYIVIEGNPFGIAALLDAPGARVKERSDIAGVLWGKLLINLNNALNALSGVPLREELSNRKWRLILAQQIEEGLAALKAAGIKPQRVEGAHAREMAFGLRLPDALFRLAARAMLKVDPAARSSMAADLEKRRRPEVDYLQGALMNLAQRHAIAAPAIGGVMRLIKAAEIAKAGSPRLSPDEVSDEIARGS
jgi:2-dehydropantoate 2-reductase